jgi:glucokinase
MYKVGIDIGGTNLRCAIFNEEMKMIKHYKTPNDKSKNAKENLKPMIDFINEFEGNI